MRNFPVAFGTSSAGHMNIMVFDRCIQFWIYKQLFMTANTIVMNHPGTIVLDEYNLRLIPKGKDGCMSQSVFCFKIIMVENVVVRNMTIVACRHFPVRTMAPGGILW